MLVKVTQKPGSEGLCGAPPTLPRGDEGRPGGRLYSQVGDARRLHLREGGPVGAEGGRAVNQRAVLSQALGRASAVVSHEPDTPGHPGTRGPRPSPHPPQSQARPCSSGGQAGPSPHKWPTACAEARLWAAGAHCGQGPELGLLPRSARRCGPPRASRAHTGPGPPGPSLPSLSCTQGSGLAAPA